MLRRVVDFALYHVVRPVGRRTPFWVLGLAARALAVPLGLGLFLFRSEGVADYLRVVGHRADTWGRLSFSVRKAHRRLLDDTHYLRPDAPPQLGPTYRRLLDDRTQAVFATWSWMGVASGARVAAINEDRIIRLPYGGEGGPAPDAVPLGGRWDAHTAAVRHRQIGPIQILPRRSPIAYIRALREGRSLLIVQDVADPEGEAPMREIVGVPQSLPVGAVRLAQLCGLPLCLSRIHYRRGQPVYDMEPFEGDEQDLLDRLSAAIRAEPWAWDHWRSVLPASVPVPEVSPVPDAALVASLRRPQADPGRGLIEASGVRSSAAACGRRGIAHC